MTHLFVAAIAAKGFFRAGRHWPFEGVTVAAKELGEDLVQALMADRNLKVVPAGDPAAEKLADDDFVGRLHGVVTGLPDDAFTAAGPAKIAAVRGLLSEADAARLTTDHLAVVHKRMVMAATPAGAGTNAGPGATPAA